MKEAMGYTKVFKFEFLDPENRFIIFFEPILYSTEYNNDFTIVDPEYKSLANHGFNQYDFVEAKIFIEGGEDIITKMEGASYPAKRIAYVRKASDFSTFVHEITHFLFITDYIGYLDCQKERKKGVMTYNYVWLRDEKGGQELIPNNEDGSEILSPIVVKKIREIKLEDKFN